MINKHIQSMSLIGVLVLTLAVCATAQTPRQMELHGSIDASGPWYVRGQWSLKINESGRGVFSAALDMQRSDYWLLQSSKSDTPVNIFPHTHHITLKDADVTWNGSVLTVSGMATITLNGGSAPVSPSTLTITISGGPEVEFSNISLTFGAPGSNHFGTDPLNGVVRKVHQ